MYKHTMRNVSEALAAGLHLLTDAQNYDVEESRNGPVRVARGPVFTETMKPLERVLFSPLRNANPFFHFFESLWMLAGRNDIPWLAQFNKQMTLYSDDDAKTQPAAYGYRWRNYFGIDQISAVVEELKQRPNSRRAVLAMWDGGFHYDFGRFYRAGDLARAIDGSNDIPCNLNCIFRLRDEGGSKVLDMMVTNRSNDLLWGAHGANAVHFSVLQEYVAALLDVGVGTMMQMSFNYHLYEGVLKHKPEAVVRDLISTDYYSKGEVTTTPLFSRDSVYRFEREVQMFCHYAAPDAPRAGIPGVTGMLRETAYPMLQAWDLHKAGQINEAIGATYDIVGDDWRRACMEWLKRVRENRKEKANG